MDSFVPRPAQQRLRDVTLQKIRRGERVVVANIYPATGKTGGASDAANALFREGFIDTVQVLTPRINLCRQFELDWQDQRRLYTGDVLGRIAWRENRAPLLRDGASGYVTTYASLVAAGGAGTGNIHLDVARRGRSLLVLDEAQLLGVDADNAGTRSAEIVTALASEAVAVLLLSGTPYRADGRPLLLASYSNPDPLGRRFLRADVTATYAEGVAGGYLRPVEFTLVDGLADLAYVDADGDEGEADRIAISTTCDGLGRVLEHRGYWARLVDRTVERIRQVQRVDARLCGLIAANTQAHAQRIAQYVRDRYPTLRTLIAVSDDARAQDNLETFRGGGYDLLITVRMAHVGYDHPPIIVVCALCDFRAPAFLHQLFARGLRMLRGLDAGLQTMYAIVPDDPQMARFAEAMRRESAEGVRERGQRAAAPGGAALRVPTVVRAAATTERASGLLPRGDLSPLELAIVARLRRSYNLAATPATTLGAMLRAGGVDISALVDVNQGGGEPAGGAGMAADIPPDPSPAAELPVGRIRPLLERERERAVRRELQGVLARCDNALRRVDPGWLRGGSATECRRVHGGSPSAECGVRDLFARLRWAREIWWPEVEGRRARAGELIPR